MLDGLDTGVGRGDTLVILPAMAGGAADLRSADADRASPAGTAGRARRRGAASSGGRVPRARARRRRVLLGERHCATRPRRGHRRHRALVALPRARMAEPWREVAAWTSPGAGAGRRVDGADGRRGRELAESGMRRRLPVVPTIARANAVLAGHGPRARRRQAHRGRGRRRGPLPAGRELAVRIDGRARRRVHARRGPRSTRLAGRRAGNADSMSLARARRPRPAGETTEHDPPHDEEVYFVTHGAAAMRPARPRRSATGDR